MTDLFLTKNATNGAALAVRKRSLLAPLAAALVLAGCMTQPVAPAPHAGVPVPARFTAVGDALPTAPWTAGTGTHAAALCRCCSFGASRRVGARNAPGRRCHHR